MNELIIKLKKELNSRGLSSQTTKSYSFFIEKFLSKTNKSVELIELSDAQAFISELASSKSTSTLMLATVSLKFLYKEILHKEFSISLPKREKTQISTLTKEEIKKLINSAEAKKSKLLLSFLYSSGLRVPELVRLKKEDLNINEKFGQINKDSIARIFPISEVICNELKQHIEKNPDSVYIFSKKKPLTSRNIQKIVQLAAKKAGISKDVHPNTLRHSFASHLLGLGVDAKLVRELMGYSSKSSQQILTLEQLKLIKNPFDSL